MMIYRKTFAGKKRSASFDPIIFIDFTKFIQSPYT